MIKLYQLKNYFSFKTALIGLIIMLSSNQLFADGSRDLYPSGKAGFRAYLRSDALADTERWPFPTLGTHYVYAKAGEKITLASSAQGAGTASIRLYNPSGTLVVNDGTAAGQIANRAAELAGPQLSGAPTGGTYAPIYYTALTDGIFRVEFISRGTGTPGVTVLANSAWTQDATAGIFAWDISVINAANSAFINGRVYTNILSLSNGITTPEANGWRGIIYALTDDGFTYRINNNGNNGLWYTFFINNNGFLDATGAPLYKSLNKTNLSATEVQNPLLADTATQVTHKMFYVLPANDLPASSTGAVPGNSTWLKTPAVIPVVGSLSVVGVEGVSGQVSTKGGYVKFNSTRNSKYTITIRSTEMPEAFTPRILRGFASSGANSIFWDGKDGSGNSLPPGNAPAEVTVQLQGAEVHFPYIDMEYNKEGTIIELLDKDNLALVSSNLVYWNDVDIPDAATNGNTTAGGRASSPKNNSQLAPTNSTGINSTINGHIWGLGATGTNGQFGDQKSIDTWAFVKGPAVTIPINIATKIADLKISLLTADKATVVAGDVLTLTVKVKNDGPSDVTAGAKFTFVLPAGYNPQSVLFAANACGTENTAITYDSATRTYSSLLALPNGCEITYTIMVVVTNTVGAGTQNFQAAILRPNDVTDPDATNPDINVPPTDAQYECTNNGVGGTCNNIRTVGIAFVPVAFPSCPTTMFLTQYAAGTGTSLYTLNNSTNPLTITQVGATSAASARLNGIGFNPIDNFIYGLNTVDNNLYRVDANNNTFDLGAVSGLAAGSYISGDIDDSGNYYVKENSGTNNKLYKINITTKVATLINLSSAVVPLDIAYNKVDGLLYGVDNTTTQLFSINPATGAVILIGATGNGNSFGAMYTDGVTGAVYGNSNPLAAFFSFNTTTGAATQVSASISASGNDGAHCVNARIIFGAELSITKTDGKTEYIPGTTNTYTVVVTNAGPFTAINAVVKDPLPTGIPAANVSYTAVASSGSTTSVVGTQTGAINDVVNIRLNGTITYTIVLTVPLTYTGNLVNVGTVAVSADNSESDTTNNSATDTDAAGVCYNDPALGTGTDTKHGITLLKRAGGTATDWPMVRKSAHTVLESNSKAFVITRMTTTQVNAIVSPQEGMMVFDLTVSCLKIYSDGVWSCFTTPACP